MKVHLRALLTGSLLAALAPFASAHAAAGPPGSLTPFPTPQLCFSQAPASGCTSAPGLESARAVAISADGLNVYVGGGTTIAAFQRNAKTGQLTQAAGAIGCVSSSVGGCGHALGLSGVSQIALSPDGRHLYAVSSIANSVTGFARDVKTGALIQLKGAAGCVRPGGLGGCASGVGLLGATALAISPDGRSLYVAGRDADAVAAFAIDPTGGALLQLGGRQACIRGGEAGECASGRALAGVDALAISPDGATLYAAAKDADAVSVLQRDATTGALTQQPGPTGCIRVAGGLGCTTGRALAQPSALAIAAGGRDIYVASASGNAVSILQRDPASGNLMQPAGVAGCIGQGVPDCAAAPLLTTPAALAMGADGTSLTVATAGDGAILTLHRDIATGALAPNTPPAGCISTTAAAGCQPLAQLGATTSLAIAPTGDALYAAVCRRPDRVRPAGTADVSHARAARRRQRADADPHALPRPERRRAHLRDRLEGHARHAGCDQGRVGDLPAEARLQGPRRVRHHRRRRLGRDHDGHRHRARHACRHRPRRAPRRRSAQGALRHGARHDRL